MPSTGLETWTSLGWPAVATAGAILVVFALLIFTELATDLVLVGAVTLLLLAGVLTPGQAFGGLANEGILTIAVLYVIVGALDATGGNTWVTEKFLSRPKSVTGALLKMMLPVSFVSAFMNNTPVVAMFLPAVNDWAKQHRIAPSKLMIPLSYAAVLSGIVTMIGTSTNLLVNGMFIANTGRSLHMFQLTGVGIPICLAGIAFVLLFHRWLLPARQGSTQAFGDPREYTVEMLVERGSPLAGKTIEQAGLRQLPNAYVAEIERDGDVIPAVGPEDRLHVGDRLVFVGVVDAVLDLQKIRGLKPATNQIFKLDGPRSQRCLIEAVVSERCPIAGLTIREGRFRSRYNAAVIAVARSGERINRKIGDIVLRAGDTLLLEAHPSFGEQHRNSRDFYLVSQVANSTPRRHERALLAVGILIAMIVVASVGWLSMLKAALLAAGAMIFTRCCSARIARDSVEWKVIFTVAAAFALGTAVQTSGLAHALAESITGFARGSPRGTLVAIYGATLVLTELVSHGAAVSLIFPIALQASAHLGLDCLPFVAAVTIAGSLGFATPLGYQTHMMVYGPGGYRFSDFLRIGIPLDILCWALAVVLIPIVIPFRPAG